MNKRPHTLLPIFHRLYTKYPQLRIQLLPDIRNLFAGDHVELNGAFDLFDRVNRCGVIFAAEFVGDLREAKM